MKKKTHALTILMLKPDVTEPSQAIKELASVTEVDLSGASVTGKLYYKQNQSQVPKWVGLFKPILGDSLNTLFNSGTSAVLLLKAGERHFAITFGYGRSLLFADCYEENFGLRVVLNSVDPEKLRSVDIQSLDAVPLSRRSQASVATNISSFGVDIEQDLVYAATGQPKNLIFGKQITGKDALRISIPLIADDMPQLLANLLTQYESDAYKANFAWIDNLSEVRSKSLIEKLDLELTAKIQAGDFDRTWLAVPDIIEWSDISGFRYQKPKRGDLLIDIGWDSYLNSLEPETSHSAETFRKQYVFAIGESSGQQIHAWTVYRCIYCELSMEGGDYTLNNGKWFKINSDFLTGLNDAISRIEKSSLTFLEYQSKDEKAYNHSVYDARPEYFALMDGQLISHGGGHSKIEFCDLFSIDKHLIHVKRYGGSSVLSHLFAQGAVSARLLLSDPDFRKKVNETLPASHKLKNVSQKPKAEDFEVVYVIASNSKDECPELPLFSKINLRNSVNQLQTYGMKVSLAFVKVSNGV